MRSTTPLPRRRARASAEEGSAYVISLLVLVLVTLLGLSLVFATQTEMLIGSNERLSNKAFYDTETAIAVAMARALVENDKSEFVTVVDSTPDLETGVPVSAVLTVSEVLPVATPWCTLCQINGTGSYGNESFFNVTHALTARALLVSSDTVITSKTIADSIGTHPWPFIEDAGATQFPQARRESLTFGGGSTEGMNLETDPKYAPPPIHL